MVNDNDSSTTEDPDRPGKYDRDFWSRENRKHAEPYFRLQKSARLLNRLAGPEACSLLDVGCGPATLMHLLRPNIQYFGIDIALSNPAPNLIETDLLSSPIRFGDMRFDIVVALGVFEYLGNAQSEKFAEIAAILKQGGTFLLSYTNFGHRDPLIYPPYSNVRSFDNFKQDLERFFVVRQVFPTAYNWHHGLPNRRLVKAANMHLNLNIPLISRYLAVEYYLLCSGRT